MVEIASNSNPNPAPPVNPPPSGVEPFNPYAGQTLAPVPLGKVVIEERVSRRVWVKLALFLGIILTIGVFSTVTITQLFTTPVYRSAKGVLLSSPLKTTVWQSFGSVPEAELELQIQSLDGSLNHSFLLDTGAVVSSLPREMAEKLGFNLAFLPRQTFRGFGNTTSFAYTAEMNLLMGDKEVTLPVVFTEAQGSKSLLGRKGLFDKYTIIVDHKSQVVEIRE